MDSPNIDSFKYEAFDKSIDNNFELYVSYAIVENGKIGTLYINPTRKIVLNFY